MLYLFIQLKSEINSKVDSTSHWVGIIVFHAWDKSRVTPCTGLNLIVVIIDHDYIVDCQKDSGITNKLSFYQQRLRKRITEGYIFDPPKSCICQPKIRDSGQVIRYRSTWSFAIARFFG